MSTSDVWYLSVDDVAGLFDWIPGPAAEDGFIFHFLAYTLNTELIYGLSRSCFQMSTHY